MENVSGKIPERLSLGKFLVNFQTIFGEFENQRKTLEKTISESIKSARPLKRSIFKTTDIFSVSRGHYTEITSVLGFKDIAALLCGHSLLSLFSNEHQRYRLLVIRKNAK